MQKILAACSGFVYVLSVAGTTGERDALPPELADHLDRLRGQTDLPLAVGFGVSKPEHVAALRGQADGAIVGSALVRRLEGFADRPREAALAGGRGLHPGDGRSLFVVASFRAPRRAQRDARGVPTAPVAGAG